MNKQLDIINKAKSIMFIKHPFFSSLLLSRNIVLTKTEETASVDCNSNLYINPSFLKKLSVDEVIFLLVHEIMHLALKHLSRRQHRDPDLWNIACDACINETLIKEKVGKFIKHGVRYPGAETKTVELVYEELLKKADNNVLNLLPGVAYVGNKVDNGVQIGGIGSDIPKVLDSGEVTVSENKISRQVLTAQSIAKMCTRGDLPGYVRNIANIHCTSTVPWQDALSEFFNSLSSQDQSWDKPNKRYVNIGQYLPAVAKFPSIRNLCIGIDTSASIDDNMLKMFEEHVNSLLSTCKPQNIKIIFCDTEVSDVKEYLDTDSVCFSDSEGKVLGGGGTNLTEIFRYIKQEEIECDGLVILTDGETQYPDYEDYQQYPFPILWAYTKVNLPYYPVQYIDLQDYSSYL